MTSHSMIRNYEEDFSFTVNQHSDEEEENEYSAEYNRLDQILDQYTYDSQNPDTAELRRLLDDVTDDEKMELLKRHDPLWRAAMTDHTEMISTILSSLSPHQRLDVLLSVEDHPPLHWAALYGHTDSVKVILSQLTSDQQLTLLSMRDEYGGTPADCASECGKKVTERVLRDYKQRAEQQIDITSLREYPTGTAPDLFPMLNDPSEHAQSFTRLEHQVQEHSRILADNDVQEIPNLKRKISELYDAKQNQDSKVRRLERSQTTLENELREAKNIMETKLRRLENNQTNQANRIRELEDRLQVQQNNSTGHGCSSTTQQTSNGLDQMVYDVIAKHESDNEELQALRQMVLNNSAGLASVSDRTQENRNSLTEQGLHEADTEQPEDNQSEDEDTEHPDMDGDDAEENET